VHVLDDTGLVPGIERTSYTRRVAELDRLTDEITHDDVGLEKALEETR
jgi:hypothetical protein